ncbi:PKD domain-containing protein [Fulvivirgaceae bacterium PWU4]|uniref:PKD domain-containing protein n=1 Tax=Chryseosolibacter histidini TaxID=2782349 RepID=A0AAP2DKP7_9BACT|nr:PKD domain-containing protein [Chryseosolibacter histidini]MBT1698120.1 PKD domain-containing protein [Chryseosolibacter histidini]
MKNIKPTLLSLFWIAAVCLMSCDDEDEKPLKADFEASAESIRAGQSVTFTDISLGQASSWKWTFEGAEPSTSGLSGPTVVYTVPGTYAVTLELANKSGTSVQTKESYITVGYNEITADFSVENTVVKQGEPVVFTDKSTGIPKTWQWEFKSAAGTVLTSSNQNPSMTFTELGTYTVKLKASNPEYSGEKTKENYITVIDPNAVVAGFRSDLAATYTGGSVSFTDESIGRAESWTWTFDGGTPSSSTAQNPSITYNTPGRYKVKLVAYNPIRSSTIEKESYVLVVPGGDLTAFFPFHGSINDAGPSKVTTTTVGTIAFTDMDRKSVASNAAVFNATGGFFVPNHDAFNFGSGNYSVSCWVKTSVAVRAMVWQESGGKGTGDNQTWMRILGTATNLTAFATEDVAGGSTLNLTAASAKIHDGVWHHVVCVRDGLNTTIFIDGVQAGTRASTNGLKVVSNEGNFKVGMQETTTGYSNQYSGLIDDLIVYKKALTPAEITALFNL